MKLTFMIIGIILGLLCGLFGIILHNYEVNKCNIVEENQYYEAKADCYMPLERPEWNLFWNVFGFALLGIFNLGIVGLIIDFERSDW